MDEPVKPEEKATAPSPEKPAAETKQAETVAEDTLEKAEDPADLLKDEPREPSTGSDEPPDDVIAQKPEQDKILTEKKPYRMDDLLEGMREMEDMMDEMKDMMDDFKKRRKK